jgi:hypothetical protein
MADNQTRLREALDQIANALQPAVVVASQQRRKTHLHLIETAGVRWWRRRESVRHDL